MRRRDNSKREKIKNREYKFLLRERSEGDKLNNDKKS